jgi:hypothetical protein
MFHAKEPVVSAFMVVSFRRRSSVWLAENITYGGSKVRFVNWLQDSLVAGLRSLEG